MSFLSVRVNNDVNNGYCHGGTWTNNNTVVYLGYAGISCSGGFRFVNVTIPQGASIQSARIVFISLGTNTGLTSTIAIGTDTYSLITALAVGSKVVITGSTNNNGTFTVATVGTTSFTVTGAVVNETATVVIAKVLDTLNLSADRLPLVPITIANWETQALEIRSDYQPYLIDGILREAYQKQDAACLDVTKSADHGKSFEKNKTRTYNEIQRLRYGPTVLMPNRGRL
jgi:hypothetical protein